MNVTSLPTGGANYRVVKTVANGNWFNGNAQALTLGTNTVTVAAVSFDRSVKFQFSSGDVEFDALTLNGVDSDCIGAADVLGCTDPSADNYDATATLDDGSCTYPSGNTSLISDCDDFVPGPNTTWTHALVATTLADGAASPSGSNIYNECNVSTNNWS